MSVQTEKYVRKPFLIDAVQVTEENMEELAKWCGGTIQEEKRHKPNRTVRFIKVDVQSPLTERQTKAFPGDWLLSSNGTYKVYTERAFGACFDKYYTGETVGQEQLTGLAEKLNTPH